MQHIASRESLKATNDFLLSTAESLDEERLTTLGFELESISDLLLNEAGVACLDGQERQLRHACTVERVFDFSGGGAPFVTGWWGSRR